MGPACSVMTVTSPRTMMARNRSRINLHANASKLMYQEAAGKGKFPSSRDFALPRGRTAADLTGSVAQIRSSFIVHPNAATSVSAKDKGHTMSR